MAKTKKKAKTSRSLAKKYDSTPFESVYVLKMVLYMIVGAQWLWLSGPSGNRTGLPVGLLIGVIFAMHDHFRIDRKIEYAVLMVAALVGYVAGIGVSLTV